MIRRAIGTMAAALVALTLASTSLWADSEVRIVRLSYVDGPVQLDRATGQGFERAILNMPITSGMTLWTQGDSRAEVEFEEGTSIRLTPGTKLEFTRLALTDEGKRSTVVTLDSGQAYINYADKKGEDFRIRTGDREIALTKGAELRIDVSPEHAEIAVLKGELQADGMQVKKNHTAELNFNGSGYQVADGVTPEVADAWNKERIEYHDTYARAGYRGASYYGTSDLNYYGAWFDSPYGNCWRPYGFGSSWSPYSSGAWVYYPSYGYSWVSMYPWGWQPYRTGAWNYIGGSTGWCWTPNRSFYGLGWAPVYHAPVGFVPVKPPASAPVTPTPPAGPPTKIVTGPFGPRGPRGVIPVGDVDTQAWRLRHMPGLPEWNGDRRRGGAPFAGANGGTTASPAGRGYATRTTTGERVNAPARQNGIDAETRQMQREAIRERQQIQREQRQQGPREQRGFGGYNAGGARSVAPTTTAPAPAAAPAPPPAPRMSAPSPSREGGRQPVPK